MKINLTKSRLTNNEVVFGIALQQYRSTEIPRLLAAVGFDYLFIDSEHGGFSLETVQDLVVASNQSGITPFVRVGEMLYSHVTRVLDVGAQGIIFPRVECAVRLREAISWMKYPPHGTRGFGFMAPQLDYKQYSMPEIMEQLNAQTMVIVQFETALSIERCDELLSVPGIDVAMVGPTDLSISLGVPGEFDHPKILEAIDVFVAACERHGVVPGIHCRDSNMAMPWLQRGMRFLGCGSEHGMLLAKARDTMAELRTGMSELTSASIRG
ncbi:MAG: aldolase/citrate lyase family protein [Acidobacteriota bacterium]|nr:aldolase/citrate lyase family protein [Acidobacteriota bacterium]